VIERRRVGKNLGSPDFQTWERRGRLKGGRLRHRLRGNGRPCVR
jgi:hypothetical protein